MSVKENQQKNFTNARQFLPSTRIQTGMQQAPMNTYQRPMFSQQPIQHLAPQQVQSMQPHLSYIIQGQGQPGNQVFNPYASVPQTQSFVPANRFQQYVFYQPQGNVAPTGPGMNFTSQVSPMPQNMAPNRINVPSQMQTHHAPTSYSNAQQQPPPPKQERARARVTIRDPNQGGKDITNEILNHKKVVQSGESGQQTSSQESAIRQEFIARAAAAKGSKKDSANVKNQPPVKKDVDQQSTQPKETVESEDHNKQILTSVVSKESKIETVTSMNQSNEEKSEEKIAAKEVQGDVSHADVGTKVPVVDEGKSDEKDTALSESRTEAKDSVDAPVVSTDEISQKEKTEADSAVEVIEEPESKIVSAPAGQATEPEYEQTELSQDQVTAKTDSSDGTGDASSNGRNDLNEGESKRHSEDEDDSDGSKQTEENAKDDGVAATSLSNGVEKAMPNTVSQVPKKKKKGKYKDKDTDMMSAFVDKPEEEVNKVAAEEGDEQELEEEEVKEETWEDKDIKTEDEAPKTEKRICYDREFLLGFSSTKEKPTGLPDIEPVLSEAHEPTKPLVRGRLQSGGGVDFMPPFMQKGSSGRQVGMNRSGKGGRAAPPKRIIPTSFETKVELKKSDNAWVRPSEVARDLPEEDKEKEDLFRKARGILNKLTPQKFGKLVEMMKMLQINTADKLKGIIDLIFQKALLEPSFSKAYAQLCDVLSKEKMHIEDGSNMTFKRLLLNKCQTEFEKEKVDEQQLEQEQSRHYENAEEEKAWQEELAYRRRMTKKRSLGNIRFIGELFKLKMLTEAIMHTCVCKLLKDRDEESLECLCQLLTTIGKDLDHDKAKPRTDQYFQQIDRMISQKKSSSRIIFMLKDVRDLRATKWVSRRATDAPKTIDEIHEEAKQEEIKMQLAHQQAAQKRALSKGGRDSPSLGRSEEGWNQVPSKSSRSIQPVDPSRLKITKRTDSDNISLGPGGRPGAWAQGASGGGSSRFALPGDGESRQNRYSALSAGEAGSHRQDGKTRSTGRTQQPSRFGRPNSLLRGGGRAQQQLSMDNERAAALEQVRRLVSNEGTQSPPSPQPKAVDDDLEYGEASGEHTPAENAADGETVEVEYSESPPPQISEERMRNEIKMTIDEFLATSDRQEAEICIRNLNCGPVHNVLVSEAINIAIEKKLADGARIGDLLHGFVKSGIISTESFKEGLAEMLEFAEDIAVDIPHIWTNLGSILGPSVEGETLPLSDLKTLIEPLIRCNKAGLLMAETLSAAAKISSEMDVNLLWQRSGLEWSKLLSDGSDVDAFIAKTKMEFTMKAVNDGASKRPSLRAVIEDPEYTSDNAIEWIEQNVPANDRSSPDFVRTLATAVFYACVTEDSSGFKFDKSNITKFNSLLKFVNSDEKCELQTLYAAQLLAEELKHPIDFLGPLFEVLYDEEIISEGTVATWETSGEELLGKGSALNSVKGFLEWLKSADDESHDVNKR